MLSNNVTLIGNLGSDINLRQTAAGQTVGSVNLAVSRTYTPKNGEAVKETNWFRLTAWAQTAERMAKQAGRGTRLLVEGRLKSGSYEGKDGIKRDTVEVVVTSFTLLDRRTAEASAAPAASALATEAPVAF